MSDSCFRSTNSPGSDFADHLNLELSEFPIFNVVLEEHPTLMASMSFQSQEPPAMDVDDSTRSSGQHGEENNSKRQRDGGERMQREVKTKVAFKTKSELDILDDGFKWRKYGKKMVKSSPNPRNYYRCSVGGCPVKKRVERDGEDPSYVITTYEGVHTHQSSPH